jgi:hypothetical protein
MTDPNDITMEIGSFATNKSGVVKAKPGKGWKRGYKIVRCARDMYLSAVAEPATYYAPGVVSTPGLDGGPLAVFATLDAALKFLHNEQGIACDLVVFSCWYKPWSQGFVTGLDRFVGDSVELRLWQRQFDGKNYGLVACMMPAETRFAAKLRLEKLVSPRRIADVAQSMGLALRDYRCNPAILRALDTGSTRWSDVYRLELWLTGRDMPMFGVIVEGESEPEGIPDEEDES